MQNRNYMGLGVPESSIEVAEAQPAPVMERLARAEAQVAEVQHAEAELRSRVEALERALYGSPAPAQVQVRHHG